MKTGRTHCLLSVSIVAIASLLTTSLQATIIVDDSFADVDRTKTGALDADWWSSSSTSGNSVEIDGTGLGLVSGTSGRGIHATFAPQTLAIGDTITATVTFTTPATVGTNKGGAFRFALMDFNNAGLAADLSSSSSSANPLYVGQPGYMSDFDVNTDATADVSLRKHDTAAVSGRFLGTTGEWTSMGSSADNGYTFAANTEYVGVFAVTRTGADSASVFSSLSQGTTLMDSHSEPDASAIANNFGMFGIWANSDVFGSTTGSDPDNGITLTNFKVEVTSIPEPSSIKLRGNDAEWDYNRMVQVGEIAQSRDVRWLSADFNCTVTNPSYVNDILDRLASENEEIYEMILYVEQPFPYELEEHPIDVHSVSARKPLLLDESAHDWRLVKLGRSLGWTGVALKTCKTQTGALFSLCWAKAHGMEVMVQDLTNPMLALIPHVLLAAHAGTIMGVEANAVQFYPEASSIEAKIHPGLFTRRNGHISLSSIRGPGFGYRIGEIARPLPEPTVRCGEMVNTRTAQERGP